MVRTENYLRELASILFAQKAVIFWTTAAIFVGGILVSAFWPPMYSATASVLLSGKQIDVAAPEALEKKPSARPFEATKEDLASEIEIILSPDVIRNALAATDKTRPPSAEDIDEIRGNLKVTPVPASNVLTVTFRDRNVARATRVLDAVLDEYLRYRLQFYRPQASQLTPAFLADRADRDRQALEAKEQELVSLIDDTGVSEPQQEIGGNIELKKRLEQELNDLVGQQVELKGTLDHLQHALDAKDLQYFAFLESLTIAKLGEKLTELTAERGRLARIYLPEAEVIVTIDEQIRGTFAALKAEVQLVMDGYRKKLQATGEKITLIRAALAEYDERNLAMEKQIIETERIRREASLLKYSYEMLAKRKGEVEINEMLSPKDNATTVVNILSRAFAPPWPVFPSPLTIPIGLVVGVMTGLAFGYLREYFDHTFKKPSDVATYVGLPVLFSLAGAERGDWKNAVYAVGTLLMVAGTVVYLLVQYKILPPQ